MQFDDLADFLTTLEDAGELARVKVEVDPVMEIAEITDRLCNSPPGGPAILFENVRGSTFPVVVNLLGNERRQALALRANSLDEAAEKIEQVLHPELPESWLGSLKLIPQLAQLTRLPPKIVKTAACQQVVKVGRDVDLRELPLLQNRPLETSPSITSGQVFTVNPETSVRDISLGLFSMRDQNSLHVHWHPQDDAWRNFIAYRNAGKQMPVAIALGGDPVMPLIAAAPLPYETDGCLLAGFLREKNVELVKARGIPIEVPASADVILEGLIDVEAEHVRSGPVALPTGFYTESEASPVLNITAITHRSNPVVPAIIHGTPPGEKNRIDTAIERLMLPIVRILLPEIIDFHLPSSGASSNVVFVKIRKQYPQQARKVMSALWGMKGFSTAKILIVVDEDIDIRNESEVWFHVAANVHPGRDTSLMDGPANHSDHAAPERGTGRKLGIDATRKLREEEHPREWPEETRMTARIRDLVERRWQEYGLS